MSRAERRHRTHCKVQQRLKVLNWAGLLEVHPSYYADNDLKALPGPPRSRLVGRCKKVKPLDCGRTRCGVCGYWKHINGRTGRYPTLTEYKAWLDYREQAAEFGETVYHLRKPA